MRKNSPVGPAVNFRAILFWVAISCVLALGGGAAVVAGRRLLLTGYLWHNDIFFGNDTLRVMRSLIEPHFIDRSNVHPLFAPVFQPCCRFIQSLGVTAGTAVILLCAGAGALGLALMAAYLRVRQVARLDALLAVVLMASSATWILESAVPNTFIISLCLIALSNLMLAWSLRRADAALGCLARWGRQGAWLLLGVFQYGVTVTNLALTAIDYALAWSLGRPAWRRTAAWGAAVLALALLLTALVGSSLNLWVEKQWVYDNPVKVSMLDHPVRHTLSAVFVWSVVAPTVRVAHSIPSEPLPIMTFLDWRYPPLGWLAAGGWVGLLVLAAGAIRRDRDALSRRLTWALLLSLAFHLGLHVFYNTGPEGVFQYNGHALFLLIGLLAPLLRQVSQWRSAARWSLRAAILLLALALAVRHTQLLASLPELIPLGR